MGRHSRRPLAVTMTKGVGVSGETFTAAGMECGGHQQFTERFCRVSW